MKNRYSIKKIAQTMLFSSGLGILSNSYFNEPQTYTLKELNQNYNFEEKSKPLTPKQQYQTMIAQKEEKQLKGLEAKLQ